MTWLYVIFLGVFLFVAYFDAKALMVPRYLLIALSAVSLALNPVFFIGGGLLGFYFYRIGVYSIGDVAIVGAVAAAVGSVLQPYQAVLVLGALLLVMELSLAFLSRKVRKPVPVGPYAFILSLLVLAWGWWS